MILYHIIYLIHVLNIKLCVMSKKKTYSEKVKDLCDKFWNDYQVTCDIEFVDRTIKYYIGRFKAIARSADKEIEKLSQK